MLARGAQSAGAGPRIVLDVRQAIGLAFQGCRPGDLLLVGCATHVEDLPTAMSRLAGSQHPVQELKVA